MAYTKGELVEQIYLRVSGGKLSDDVHIQRVDIEPYLAAAINYAMVKEIRIRKREAIMNGEWDSDLDPDFLGTYYPEIQTDDQRGLRYAELPVKIQSLPGNLGLQEVFPLYGEVNFVKIKGQFEVTGLNRVLKCPIYWFETVGISQRVYFKNLSRAVTKVAVRAVASIQDLEDEDVVPVPPGMEVEIIDICVGFFTGQRQMPSDMIANNNDEKQG